VPIKTIFKIDLINSTAALAPNIRLKPEIGLSFEKLGSMELSENKNPPVAPDARSPDVLYWDTSSAAGFASVLPPLADWEILRPLRPRGIVRVDVRAVDARQDIGGDEAALHTSSSTDGRHLQRAHHDSSHGISTAPRRAD
jgi:hypothetical protein